MPDLSKNGIGQWLTDKSSALGRALRFQATLEPWTCDEDPQVLQAAIDAGIALDAPNIAGELAQQPSIDLIRRALTYLSPARRFALLAHLDALGQLHHVDITLALIDSIAVPPESEEAATDVLFLNNSLAALEAQRLLHEVFDHERLTRILMAITSTGGPPS